MNKKLFLRALVAVLVAAAGYLGYANWQSRRDFADLYAFHHDKS